MKKIALIIFVFSFTFLLADSYKVDDFESDIFSKSNNQLKKIDMSLIFEGRDVKENDYKILDALNVIVSSFYVEELFTSKGKERFKKLLIEYISKKYMIDVDFIYIIKFKINEKVDIDYLIQKLEQNKILDKNTKDSKSSNTIQKESQNTMYLQQ